MPYYISVAEAKKITRQIISDRCKKFEAFLKHFDDTKKMTFTTPKVFWRGMGGRVAGRCFLVDHIIEMNSNYLTSPSYKDFIEPTLIHELAHSISWELFHEAKHGRAWKIVAKFLGDDGEVYHSLEAPTVNHVEALDPKLKHIVGIQEEISL